MMSAMVVATAMVMMVMMLMMIRRILMRMMMMMMMMRMRMTRMMINDWTFQIAVHSHHCMRDQFTVLDFLPIH